MGTLSDRPEYDYGSLLESVNMFPSPRDPPALYESVQVGPLVLCEPSDLNHRQVVPAGTLPDGERLFGDAEVGGRFAAT